MAPGDVHEFLQCGAFGRCGVLVDINAGKTLQVDIYVEDPGTFATPCDAIQR